MKAMLALVLVGAFLHSGRGADTPDAASSTAPAKPDLKKLLEADSFTNSTAMVMVRINPKLWAGKYLVTQAEYRTVMGINPSRFQGATLPVDSISWNDAMAFCAKLTEEESKAELLPEGFTYTLPTQDQWLMLTAGASLQDAVTSQRVNRSSTAPVGSLKPNRLGLFDTRGNLWQWTLDPQDQPYRVLRGGAWNSFIEINLRPEFRWYSNGPDERKETFGFRCVLRPK